VQYSIALANEGGGKLVLGVEDSPRKVVGTAAFPDLSEIKYHLLQKVHLRIEIEVLQIDALRVLVVHVPARPIGRPLEDNGTYWMRAGESLVGMTAEQLQRIFSEAAPDYSAEICRAATLHDLNPAAVDEFRKRWSAHSENNRLKEISAKQLLEDASLLVNGAITYAALVLFGTETALQRHLSQAEIIFEYKSSERAGPAQQRENLREGFFSCYDRLWKLINLRNDLQHYSEGLFVYDIPTFDERTIREALLNAVSHRDYRLGGSIFIRQFPQKIEIVSPGGLPEGITLENIIDRQNPRNRRIAEAFEKCNLVERSGQGMNLIYESLIGQSKPLPDFSNTDAYQVSLTISGQVKDPLFVRFLEKVASEKPDFQLGTHDLILLNQIHSSQPIDPKNKDRLKELIGLGVVEYSGHGRGTRYLLSRSFFELVGQSGVHTRRQGLSRAANKELLLQHIRQSSGATMAEFRQVLPTLSDDQIKSLIKCLKKEGKIIKQGKTRGSIWISTGYRHLG
jgi:ATP-dependent DNA helicase RecG